MLLERLIAVWLRAKALVHRSRLDRDLDEELSFHVAMRTQDHGGGGDGRVAANRQLETRPGFARPAVNYGPSLLLKRCCRTCVTQPARWARHPFSAPWQCFPLLWESERTPHFSA